MPNPPLSAMNPEADLLSLNGKIVLVRFANNERDFPVALRGTLEVHPAELPGQPPVVELILVFPDMFNISAYQRVMPLADDDLRRLLASECNGTFEFTIHNELGVAG
jgi:hypothetical protein